jgi:hypothetical protein
MKKKISVPGNGGAKSSARKSRTKDSLAAHAPVIPVRTAVIATEAWIDGMPPEEGGACAWTQEIENDKVLLLAASLTTAGAPSILFEQKKRVVIFSPVFKPELCAECISFYAKPSEAYFAVENIAWIPVHPITFKTEMAQFLSAEWGAAEDEQDRPLIVVWPVEIMLPEKTPDEAAVVISEACFGFASVFPNRINICAK